MKNFKSKAFSEKGLVVKFKLIYMIGQILFKIIIRLMEKYNIIKDKESFKMQALFLKI